MLVFVNGKLGYLWLRDHDALFAAESLILRLNVAKCARYTEASGQYAVWSIQHLSGLSSYLPKLIRNGNSLIRLRLVHLTTVVLYPVELVLLIRSMVL